MLETIAAYPYLGVAVVFLLCGMGLPLPEELVLIASGYVCHRFPDKASLVPMMAWCGGAILVGDLIPYVLGRVFGTRLLRIRWLRMVVTRRRLAQFDRWFRRRGDLVIFVARFLAGIRVVAFFTAGTMKMRWRRFLLLDGLGIAVIVPTLVYAGWSGAEVINSVIDWVSTVERGILWTAVGGSVLVLAWYWLARRRRARRLQARPAEAFVQPRIPPAAPSDDAAEAPADAPANAPDGEPAIGTEPSPAPPAGPGDGEHHPPSGPDRETL